ncbi:hypothetical protein BGW38_001849, partial [Lunasporangiospora selenospora]
AIAVKAFGHASQRALSSKRKSSPKGELLEKTNPEAFQRKLRAWKEANANGGFKPAAATVNIIGTDPTETMQVDLETTPEKCFVVREPTKADKKDDRCAVAASSSNEDTEMVNDNEVMDALGNDVLEEESADFNIKD